MPEKYTIIIPCDKCTETVEVKTHAAMSAGQYLDEDHGNKKIRRRKFMHPVTLNAVTFNLCKDCRKACRDIADQCMTDIEDYND